MRVTIKGLTDSTIAFNTIGIILRGNSSKPELYPNSIARHIDIKNDEQMRELVTLKNANLIAVINEDIVQAQINVPTPIAKPINTAQIIPISQPKPTKVEDNIEPVEEIEDGPCATCSKEEPEIKAPKAKKAPKGKKAKTTKTTKATKAAKATKVTIKPIKASKNRMVAPPSENKEDDSKIVVMTPNGPIAGNAVNNMAGEIQESEATRASIEALRQMEEEEAMPESLVDESKLDVSEKMGGTAVVATGDNLITKVAMKNSILPDADSIKKRGIKFISPEGDDTPMDGKPVKDTSADAFIDESDNKTDGSSDDFIEC